MAERDAAVVDVVEEAIGNLQDALVNDVLVGLYAELDAFESLGEPLRQLLLDCHSHAHDACVFEGPRTRV